MSKEKRYVLLVSFLVHMMGSKKRKNAVTTEYIVFKTEILSDYKS